MKYSPDSQEREASATGRVDRDTSVEDGTPGIPGGRERAGPGDNGAWSLHPTLAAVKSLLRRCTFNRDVFV